MSVKVYMMVGIPSSGKSTWARRMCPGCVVVSTDDIRQELFGDPHYPFHLDRVLRLAHQRVIAALKSGRDVVYDTTNIEPMVRGILLNRLRAAGLGDVKVIAVVMQVKPEEALQMQKLRQRKVSSRVVKAFWRNYVPPSKAEGFWEIRVVPSQWNLRTP